MMGGFGGFSQAAELSARLPPEAPKEWEGRRFPAAESTQVCGAVLPIACLKEAAFFDDLFFLLVRATTRNQAKFRGKSLLV
jgi:hypothetical protein